MRLRILIILSLIVSVLLFTSGYVVYAKGYRLDTTTYDLMNINPIQSQGFYELTLIEVGDVQKYSIPTRDYYHASVDTTGITFDSTNMVTDRTLDRETVEDCITQFLGNRERHNTLFSKLSSDCTYTPSVMSNLVDYDKLVGDVMANWKLKSEYDVTEYYYGYKDTNADKYEKLLQKLENLYIGYTSGDVVYAKDLDPVYHVDTDTITYDNDKVASVITPITLKYDTVGKFSTTINSVNQGIVTVSGGTWGTLSDTNAEIEYVINAFNNMQSEASRVPILKQNLPNELPSDYIEVDKSAQHVYVHEGDTIAMESPCVTGRPNGHSTPIGIFYISECMKNKTLRGPGYASFVNRWMRLTGEGVGLHDATWRGSFGGEIYKSNGSHGCINLPKAFAYELYDYVVSKPKFCVIVHE